MALDGETRRIAGAAGGAARAEHEDQLLDLDAIASVVQQVLDSTGLSALPAKVDVIGKKLFGNGEVKGSLVWDVEKQSERLDRIEEWQKKHDEREKEQVKDIKALLMPVVIDVIKLVAAAIFILIITHDLIPGLH